MYTVIRENLTRQSKGLELLRSLLQEEFELLVNRKTDDVMSLEFSIHELIRQLAAEKGSLQRLLGGGKVLDYAQMLEADHQAEIIALWQEIDNSEQYSSQQATMNAELSLGLLDQSKSLLTYLHKRIQPQTPTTYGRQGAYLKKHPEAAIISGRL